MNSFNSGVVDELVKIANLSDTAIGGAGEGALIGLMPYLLQSQLGVPISPSKSTLLASGMIGGSIAGAIIAIVKKILGV